jgi:hypothetical protein
MSLFYLNYDCHPGSLVARKSDGVVFRVKGNVSLWDMTAILVPHTDLEPDANVETFDDVGLILVKPKDFKNQFLVLDEGVDELAALLGGLRQLPK